jgi:hypothetical protein
VRSADFRPAVEFFLPKNGSRPAPIEQFVTVDGLQRQPNILDSLCLLATGDELASGEFDEFIERLLASLRHSAANRAEASKMDFRALVLRKAAPSAVWKLQPFFRNVALIRSNMPEKFNFYDRTAYRPEALENRDTRYGLKAAPNYHFFEVMPALSQYNTTLLLETDCYLGDDWLARLAAYAKSAGGFWISGATYSGVHVNAQAHRHSSHINGGTSLYAVGHKGFQQFLKFCRHIAPKYFQIAPWVPYDCLIDQIIHDHYDYDLSQRAMWQFIAAQYKPVNLILNYSPERDRGLCHQKLKAHTNYAILHKKTCRAPDALPVFWHFPKCGGSQFYERCLVESIQRTAVHEYHPLPAVSLHLVDERKNIVAGVVASGDDWPRIDKNNPSGPRPCSLREFIDSVYAGRVKKIFAAKLVSMSSYSQHLALLERMLPRVPAHITLLRRPLARYESEFYYLRDMGTWEPTYGRFGGMTFEEYVRSDKFEDNWLVRRLNDILSPGISVTEAHAAQAIATLERCTLLGFLEEIAAFTLACEENFGYTPPIDAHIRNKNTVSTKDPISDAVQAYFNDRCQYDNLVYEHFWSRRQNGLVIPPAKLA